MSKRPFVIGTVTGTVTGERPRKRGLLLMPFAGKFAKPSSGVHVVPPLYPCRTPICTLCRRDTQCVLYYTRTNVYVNVRGQCARARSRRTGLCINRLFPPGAAVAVSPCPRAVRRRRFRGATERRERDTCSESARRVIYNIYFILLYCSRTGP